MHNTLQRNRNKVKKLERRNLNEDQRQVVDGFKVILNTFQAKESKGLAFTSEDEAILKALEIFIDYMVKDSSITWV